MFSFNTILQGKRRKVFQEYGIWGKPNHNKTGRPVYQDQPLLFWFLTRSTLEMSAALQQCSFAGRSQVTQVHKNSKLKSLAGVQDFKMREFLPVPHTAHTELQATDVDRPPPARPTLWFAGISTPRPLWPLSPAPSPSVCLYPCCLRRSPQSERLRRR